MSPEKLNAIIAAQLQYFDSAEQRAAFQSIRIKPVPVVHRFDTPERRIRIEDNDFQVFRIL